MGLHLMGLRLPVKRSEMAMTESGKCSEGRSGWRATIAVTLALTAPFAFCDVSSSAQALNSRHAGDPLYLGYTGKKWDRDYGVLDGRCNRHAVSAALDGTGLTRTSHDQSRPVATVLGAINGTSAGPAMDEKDRACLGQTLELAGIERAVAWTNAGNGVVYRVIPLGGFSDNGRPCREFVTRFTMHGRTETVREKACSAGDGVWHIVG